MKLMETNQASFDCSNLENPILASSLMSYGEIMFLKHVNGKCQPIVLTGFSTFTRVNPPAR